MTSYDVPAPNYTQIPNCVLEAMPSMSEAEIRVCLYICRQTFGYHKQRDRISLSQFEDNTGLARTSVKRGLDALIKRGWVARVAIESQGFAYELVVAQVEELTSSAKLPVAQSYQYREATGTSSAKLPELVAQSYTQKKERKLKEKGRETAPAAPDATTPKRMNGTRLTHDTLPAKWRAFCAEKRPDLDPSAVWEKFHDYWIGVPGKRGTKLDWFATWRNWVREEKRGTANVQAVGGIPAPRISYTPDEEARRLHAKRIGDLDTVHAIDQAARARRQSA